MKKILLLVAVLITAYVHAQTNVFPSTGAAGIGTLTPNASSLLDVTSTTKGILIPRMTGAQRNAIVSPATGLLVYQTNGAAGFYYYSGTAWTAVSPKGVTKSLSNLTGPTAVNVSLLPATSAAIDLGSSSSLWRDGYFSRNVSIGTASGYRLSVHNDSVNFYVPDWGVSGNTIIAAGFSALGTGSFGPQIRFSANHDAKFYDVGMNGSLGFTIEENDDSRLTIAQGGNVGIGTGTPNASSLLEINSTSKGFLAPRMTKTQRDAIVSPATGLMIYQTDSTPGFYYYSGTGWTAVSPTGVNKSLSNLTGPTAVNVSLLPATSAAIDLGDSSLTWKNAFLSGVFYIDNTGTFAAKNSSGTYENYFWPRWSDNRTVINYGTGNFEIRNNASTVTMTLTDGNRVGIGTQTPAGQFELSLDQGRKPSTSTWTIASDERLKNIDGTYTKGLKEILQLKPIRYHYKNAGNRKFDAKALASEAVGFTAQDVQKIFPECVSTDEDGYLNLNIHAILVAQVNAIQQLSAENDALKSTLEKQQQQINAILQKLNEVQSAQQACCNQTSVAQTGNNASITLNSNDIASLKQNAPNPFNSTTVINYTLPQHVSNAQIKITDVKGNTIKTATVSTSGSLTVAAGSLASGTYKYSLLVDGKLIDTKTMVLTK